MYSSNDSLVVIGDVGGHLLPFKEQLLAVGADPDEATIPDGLIVCQVGDLVHKGPDSDAVVALVDRLMTANPGRWVQLVGNHESQYLPGGSTFWSPEVSEVSAATLRRWWDNGAMRIAAHFRLATSPDGGRVGDSPGGELLVTHAGLTAGGCRLLGTGRESLVADIAATLNEAAAPVVWREGAITGGAQDMCAGPLWAIATSEVYTSWVEVDDRIQSLPVFHQAHGHTSAMSWRRGTWRDPMELFELRGVATLAADERRKVTRVGLGARTFFGTDPESGRSPVSVSVPLILPLAPATPATPPTNGEQDSHDAHQH